MLSKDDLAEIRLAVEGALETQLEDKLDALLSEKLKHLPTKDEFYNKMDEIMGELKAVREEQTVTSHHLSDHENRITRLEVAHPEIAAS